MCRDGRQGCVPKFVSLARQEVDLPGHVIWPDYNDLEKSKIVTEGRSCLSNTQDL